MPSLKTVSGATRSTRETYRWDRPLIHLGGTGSTPVRLTGGDEGDAGPSWPAGQVVILFLALAREAEAEARRRRLPWQAPATYGEAPATKLRGMERRIHPGSSRTPGKTRVVAASSMADGGIGRRWGPRQRPTEEDGNVGEASRGVGRLQVVLEQREEARLTGIEADRDGGHGGDGGHRELLELV